MSIDNQALGAFARALYPVAAAFAIFPLVDLAGRLLPLQFSNAQWRFGAIGLYLSGSLVMMMFGLVILGLVAAYRQHRVALWIVAVTSMLVVVITVGAIVVFGLDAIQLRSVARPELRSAFIRSATTATLAGLLSITGFTALALACFRARRSIRRGPGDAPSTIPVLGATQTPARR
jgi:hypothetical protein